MITTAMLWKKASVSSGLMPRMVVRAAMDTGRTRLMEASSTACRASLPLASCSWISSTRTMPFFTSMPLRLSRPSRAIKPKGMPVSRKPRVTPIIARGTVSQITVARLNESNSRMVIINITR